MAPINQISRLSKIPQLLNKKRETEKESKKKKEEKEAPPFPPGNKIILEKSTIKKVSAPRKEVNPQSSNKNIGANIDLSV
jgi:hypothetical protein